MVLSANRLECQTPRVASDAEHSREWTRAQNVRVPWITHDGVPCSRKPHNMRRNGFKAIARDRDRIVLAGLVIVSFSGGEL